MKQNGSEEPPTPAENIEALIYAGTEEGLIQEEDRKLIQSVVEFGDKMVREVMTPRPEHRGHLRRIAPSSSCGSWSSTSNIRAFRCTKESIDQIVGFVHVRDMFELEEEERAQPHACAN